MKILNPEYIKFVLPFINFSPFFKLLNMKLIGLSYGESHLEINIEKKHLQAYQSVHGGPGTPPTIKELIEFE